MAQFGASGIYYTQYMYTNIYTHTHYTAKDYASKIAEKSILNNFSINSLEEVLSCPSSNSHKILDLAFFWTLFTEPFFECHIHSRTLPILQGI